MMQALRRFLKENDMMAYLTMIANRLLELHRVLKPTGSLYLHCDPTASHYLRIVLDGIFGAWNFRNEIIWKRRYGTFSTVHESNKFGACTDAILFYAKSDQAEFNPQYSFDDPNYREYLERTFRYVDETGRRYRIADLANPAYRPNLIYEYKGYKPPKKGWAISREKMELWDKEGRLYFPKSKDGRIQRKRFLDEVRGKPVQNLWDDIEMISSQSAERLGYPTQKPLALLERIIKASSKEGDVVLDPFCGCGTAIHAAEKLKRRWIGVDVTHLAINLVEDRLRAAFPGVTFDVHGVPKDFDSARDLAQRDKYEFQYWACSLVKAQPYRGKKKGADTGIDGVIPIQDDKTYKQIIVSVKAGEHVSVPMIRELAHVVNREKAPHGFFVTLAKPTAPMKVEAVKAGYYKSPVGPKPKIQILTIEGLLNGTEHPDYCDFTQGGLTTRKAKREVDAIQLSFGSDAYLSAVKITEEPSRKPARVARAAKPRKASRKTA